MSDAFLRHLTLKIRPSMFLPGDFIVHKGDVGLGLFFLYHGKVYTVEPPNNGHVGDECF